MVNPWIILPLLTQSLCLKVLPHISLLRVFLSPKADYSSSRKLKGRRKQDPEFNCKFFDESVSNETGPFASVATRSVIEQLKKTK